MKISGALAFTALLAILSWSGPTQAEEKAGLLPEPELADTGLHIQPWFTESFLDLKEDLAEARAEGKGLLVFVELAGCPYCHEMHQANLRDPETVDYLKAHFKAVQLNFRGAREVTDLDGEALEEREAIRRWGVQFTPTILLFDKTGPAGEDGTAAQQAAAIMPGYFKPFHFRTMLEFVAEGHHAETHFQDYVNERAERLRSEGKKVEIW